MRTRVEEEKTKRERRHTLYETLSQSGVCVRGAQALVRMRASEQSSGSFLLYT